MRILLIGEFSRLHNSLKEGLLAHGHEVTLISNGDGFKNYPDDISTRAKVFETFIGSALKKFFNKIFRLDFVKLEHGVRFYFHLKKLKNFDVVQFINESPIQTYPRFERFLLKKIFQYNSNCFLLCCGPDFIVTEYLMSRKERYSILNPFFENKNAKKEYDFILNFVSKEHKKTHILMYQNIKGVIASDIDYHLPMNGHNKYLGMISNPVNIDKIENKSTKINNKIIIFLGINRGTYYTKGIHFFEKALEIISKKYTDSIEIIVAENLPYKEYIKKYNSCHILLDQVYGYDQGYNALEAMAKGKVVFTGAEKEFYNYYQIEDKVAINALPSVAKIVEELSMLIENPNEILTIGMNAKSFIKNHHDYKKIASNYVNKWDVKD